MDSRKLRRAPDCQAGENILPVVVRAENERGFIAVDIAEVLQIVHTHTVARLVLLGVGVPLPIRAVVAGNALAVVVRLVRVVGREVVRNQAAVFIQRRIAIGVHALVLELVPEVRAAVAHHVLRIVGLLQRVDDLNVILVLICHQVVVFRFAQVDIREADQRVGIHAQVVVRHAIGIGVVVVFLLHDRHARFLTDGVIVMVADFADLFLARAIPEARVFKQRVLRQHRLVVAVAELHRVRRDKRRDDGKQQQEHNQAERHNGGLVLAEAQPRVAQIADGLGLQLFVMDALILVNKRKLLLRDFRIQIFFHHFFDPILMRGSINP